MSRTAVSPTPALGRARDRSAGCGQQAGVRRQLRRGAWRRGRLVGAMAAMAVLAGCTGSTSPSANDPSNVSAAEPSAGSTTRPDTKPAADPPRVGDCRVLAYADISHFSNDTALVSCGKRHTAFTFDVKTLPEDIAFKGVSIGNDAVQNTASTACRTSFERFIGGDSATRALARLSVAYFVPTQPDFDRGAHWVRCDVVAVQSAAVLAQLPRNLRRTLDNPDSLNLFGVCSQDEPGSPGARLVMCSQDHAYRAVAALRLGGTAAPYPGEGVTRDDGEQRCADFLEELLGARGGYTYGWTYPSVVDWRAGQRFGYCWHKTAA